ncbi:GNAT family N-acetyltransferase [Sinorhizobium meliloti]|nr:GNAT family N-acetyltransferase [Sinorhizobium meliloti]MDX0318881.1 GNAT family N-acetyltransferase [Sinorhizobium meliloti]MDX0325523.1 GNAT family N-acetyltransferase [Sinorhizobium meliloti]
MTIDIRRAVGDDLPDIARVVVDSWRSTFAGILPAAFLDGMSYDHQQQRHERMLARADVIYYVTVHPVEGIIGFASGGPTRHGGFPQQNEVYAIYLLPAYQRQNLGSLLFRNVVSDLKSSGRAGLAVFALSSNPNRDFYKRFGGRETAAPPIAIGDLTVDQTAYVWEDIAFT